MVNCTSIERLAEGENVWSHAHAPYQTMLIIEHDCDGRWKEGLGLFEEGCNLRITRQNNVMLRTKLLKSKFRQKTGANPVKNLVLLRLI